MVRIQLCLVFALIGCPGVTKPVLLWGQRVSAPQVDEIDGRSRLQLEQTRGCLENGQWKAAAELLSSLLRRGPRDSNRLVLRTSSQDQVRHAVSVAQYIQDLISALPGHQREQLLVELRKRGNKRAESLLQNGRQNADDTSLRSIVEKEFYSTSGDQALLRLGDISLGRGHYAMARGYWRQISPDLYERDDELLVPFAPYPDSEISLADVRARFVLASVLEGRLADAAKELAELRSLHPGARGQLGGIDVDLAEALEKLVNASKSSETGGEPIHRKRPTASLATRPKWRAPLSPRHDVDILAKEPPPVFRPATLPIATDESLFYVNAGRLCGRVLQTGAALAWSHDELGTILQSPNTQPLFLDPWPFALSVHRKRVFAVLDRTTNDATTETMRAVVGIDVPSEGRIVIDTPLQQASRRETKRLERKIVGPVVSHGRRHFVAVRDNASQPETSVVCFNATGPLWTTPICRAETYADGNEAHVPLLYYEGHILAVTQSGAVASLEADTGKVRWITIYPRTELTPAPVNLLARPWFRYRIRAAPEIDRGLLVAAPADFAGLIAMDFYSGRMLWQTNVPADTFDVSEIVAMTDDHVIANGRRLWWIDRETGMPSKRKDQRNPFPREIQAGLRSHGTAFGVDDYVFWPARDDQDNDWIYVFESKTGKIHQPPIRLSDSNVEAGNVLVESGLVVIAGKREIVAYEVESAAKKHKESAAKVE